MKVALVTGAAKRIGKVIADRLLRKNFRLLLHANTSVVDLKAWVNAHELKSQVIDIIGADLATAFGQEALVSQVKSNTASLDLLVHNASLFFSQAFSDIDRRSYRKMLAVNLEAPFFITQGLLPVLENAKHPSVINIVDAMWESPSPKYSHYYVSKAGLVALTRSLALELAPRIRVNAVAPGAIMFQDRDKEAVVVLAARIPLAKLGDAGDIAEAVLYLSDRADYVTGHTLFVDGGRSIAP